MPIPVADPVYVAPIKVVAAENRTKVIYPEVRLVVVPARST